MLRARLALNDCAVALQWLEDDTEEVSFRIHWVGLCALLRAVGHVLHKVDRDVSTAHRRVIEAHWKAWSTGREQHRVFWAFIEAERNNVLKQYELGYQEGDVPFTIPGEVDAEVHILPGAIFKPMLSGPFAGEDARDVARDAIKWWHIVLDEIEKELAPNFRLNPSGVPPAG